MGNNGEFVYARWEGTGTLGLQQICNDKKSNPPYTFFIDNEFELIEEQQNIDIQDIKELTCEEGDYKTETINELIKAIKQLDRKIREEK